MRYFQFKIKYSVKVAFQQQQKSDDSQTNRSTDQQWTAKTGPTSELRIVFDSESGFSYSSVAVKWYSKKPGPETSNGQPFY
jgi:hypothetical protein